MQLEAGADINVPRCKVMIYRLKRGNSNQPFVVLKNKGWIGLLQKNNIYQHTVQWKAVQGKGWEIGEVPVLPKWLDKEILWCS